MSSIAANSINVQQIVAIIQELLFKYRTVGEQDNSAIFFFFTSRTHFIMFSSVAEQENSTASST
jgi:hypothetical protein